MLAWHTVSAKQELFLSVSPTLLLKGYNSAEAGLGARVTGFRHGLSHHPLVQPGMW